jgi:hypothetical protein
MIIVLPHRMMLINVNISCSHREGGTTCKTFNSIETQDNFHIINHIIY